MFDEQLVVSCLVEHILNRQWIRVAASVEIDNAELSYRICVVRSEQPKQLRLVIEIERVFQVCCVG